MTQKDISLEELLTQEEQNVLKELAFIYHFSNVPTPYCPECTFQELFHGNIDAFREALLITNPTLLTPDGVSLDREWKDGWMDLDDPLREWYPDGAECYLCGKVCIEAQADRTTDTDQIAIDRYLEIEEQADNSDLHADDFTIADLPESGY